MALPCPLEYIDVSQTLLIKISSKEMRSPSIFTEFTLKSLYYLK
ncbi:MAG: hypothetical protein RMY34_32500 [Aulosira sp. DedQUE10]|nr:hypothetical protein [Aulosira sp. DedQUE10]